MKTTTRNLTINAKVLGTIIGLWLVGASLLVLMSYAQAGYEFKKSIRTRVRDYAALGALSLPADAHARISGPADEARPEYAEVVEALKLIQSNSTDIEYAYTVRKQEDGRIAFIGDATEDPDERSHPGDICEAATPLLVATAAGTDEVAMEEDFYTDAWGTFLSAYAPIRTSDGAFDGLLCLDISYRNVNALLLMHLARLAVILAACTVVIIPAALVLSRSITRPVKRFIAVFRQMSDGEVTDLTHDLDAGGSDELGDMARIVNATFGKLRGLIATIRAQADIISGVGHELSSNMEQTAASIAQISANIQSVNRQTENQASSVAETNRATDRIIQNITKLDGLIEEQAESVGRSSSAIEEMIASISSVTGVLNSDARNITELMSASEAGRSDLAAVSGRIRDISKESAELLEISAVIQGIASKTNLLSMNAAIEAAHAGDSGRGFAVVADEIRNLAESSGKQSKTISASLKKMRNSMEEITASTDKVLAQFEDIGGRIRSVAEREQGIRASMEEQTAGSKEILEAISRLGDISGEVRSGSADMLSGSHGVMQASAADRKSVV